MRGKRTKLLKKLFNAEIFANVAIVKKRPEKYKNNIPGFLANLFRGVKRDYTRHKVTAAELFTDIH